MAEHVTLRESEKKETNSKCFAYDRFDLFQKQ